MLPSTNPFQSIFYFGMDDLIVFLYLTYFLLNLYESEYAEVIYGYTIETFILNKYFHFIFDEFKYLIAVESVQL